MKLEQIKYVITYFLLMLKNLQRKRVLARPNMTEEKFKQINNAQWTYDQEKNETIYNKYIIW